MFTIYSGFVNVGVFLESPPKEFSDLNDAAFKVIEPSSSEVMITPMMRKSAGHENGIYYICMFAHTQSSYSILVSEVSADTKFK